MCVSVCVCALVCVCVVQMCVWLSVSLCACDLQYICILQRCTDYLLRSVAVTPTAVLVSVMEEVSVDGVQLRTSAHGHQHVRTVVPPTDGCEIAGTALLSW